MTDGTRQSPAEAVSHAKPFDVSDEMLATAMRAFEPLSSVLRYREKEKWHTCDMMAMRDAIRAVAPLIVASKKLSASHLPVRPWAEASLDTLQVRIKVLEDALAEIAETQSVRYRKARKKPDI